jgi:hypothetical protein
MATLFPEVTILEVQVESLLLGETADVQVLTEIVETVGLTLENPQIEILEVATQGPPGPAGAPGTGAAPAYDQRSDMVTDDTIYRAEALPGTLDTAPAWRIRRITINYGDQVTTTTAWPAGDDSFAHAWSDRLTYNYE